jgi:hypothetical protein
MNLHLWKEKLTLAADEELKHESSKTSGFMQEEDIDIYSIVRSDGTKTGSVKVSDHTAVKGFKRTIHVLQTDLNGKTVVDLSLRPSRDQ